MKLAEKLAKALEEARGSVEYWQDIAETDFTRDLHDRMAKLGISQGELARRMGTSRPYVTKLLDGGNFTLHTMVKLAMALDAVVRVRLEGKEERAEEQTEIETATPEKAQNEWLAPVRSAEMGITRAAERTPRTARTKGSRKAS
ncbi:MAG TPA: helix-turn-helix transcriptional regulator [Thermoanaerobaculia bacterium]|nr:helix-turn-helix transcriptional regulator [Thermoanaerobaculia bacterium]